MAKQLSLFDDKIKYERKMLGYEYPQLLKEWDYEKNHNLNPYKIGVTSTQKVWWICPIGHSYYSGVGVRTRKGRKTGNGCPICSSQKLLKGFNDLKTKYPSIAKEWDEDKNFPIKSDDVFPVSSKKYWWKCQRGHSYYKSPASRTNLNTGCPICANKQVLAGYNDLATIRPELLSIWNYEKNNNIGLFPTNVTPVSGKKAWWKCQRGHEWYTTIAHIAYGRGCPICHGGIGFVRDKKKNNKSFISFTLDGSTSFPEQAIFYFMKKIDESCINRYKLNGKHEIDIFIPGKNVGIEYDGYRWHRDEDKNIHDILKDNVFNQNNIYIYRIKEQQKKNSQIVDEDYVCLNDNEYYLNDEDYVALGKVIEELIKKIFNVIVEIDIEKERINIYENYLFDLKEHSVANNKKIIKYWDYENNKSIDPKMLTRSSGKIVWWKCDKGHSFKASVHSMDQGKYCPICKEEQYKKLGFDFKDKKYIGHLKNINDIKSFVDVKPELLKEWDYEKNQGINPYNLFPGTSQYVWWKCSACGHEWKSPVANRVKGHGCQKCGYKKAANKLFNPVEQYSKDGTFIKEYRSVKDAIKETGILHVSCACRGNRKTAGGYIWKYKK